MDIFLFFCSVDDDEDGKGDGEEEEEVLFRSSGMCALLCFTTRCPRYLVSGDFRAVLKGKGLTFMARK